MRRYNYGMKFQRPSRVLVLHTQQITYFASHTVMQMQSSLALFLFLFFPFGKNKDGSLPLCIIVIIDIVYDDGLVFMSASYFLWPCNYLEKIKSLYHCHTHL